MKYLPLALFNDETDFETRYVYSYFLFLDRFNKRPTLRDAARELRISRDTISTCVNRLNRYELMDQIKPLEPSVDIIKFKTRGLSEDWRKNLATLSLPMCEGLTVSQRRVAAIIHRHKDCLTGTSHRGLTVMTQKATGKITRPTVVNALKAPCFEVVRSSKDRMNVRFSFIIAEKMKRVTIKETGNPPDTNNKMQRLIQECMDHGVEQQSARNIIKGIYQFTDEDIDAAGTVIIKALSSDDFKSSLKYSATTVWGINRDCKDASIPEDASRKIAALSIRKLNSYRQFQDALSTAKAKHDPAKYAILHPGRLLIRMLSDLPDQFNDTELWN